MLLRIGEFLAIAQRDDRSALDELEFILDQAPFDVLGTAEVGFAPPAQLGEPHNCANRDDSEQIRTSYTIDLDASRRSAPKH
jgi:hypothetical protein